MLVRFMYSAMIIATHLIKKNLEEKTTCMLRFALMAFTQKRRNV